MPKKSQPKRQDPHAVARAAVSRYFAELEKEIPSDRNDVDLLNATLAVEDALIARLPREQREDSTDASGHREGSVRLAGYLVGLELGRRLAGGGR